MTTRNTARGAERFFCRSQKTGEVLIMARKAAKSNGTKIGSAARMPATTMTNAATASSNRPAGDWEENVCIRFFGKSGFLVKSALIYRTTCALFISMISVFSFSVLRRRRLKVSLDVRKRGRRSSGNVDASGFF